MTSPSYRFFLLLYHLAWTLGSAAALPPALMTANKRLRERLALQPPGNRPKQGGIWIHALSVGEVMSAVPLAKRLAGEYPQSPLVLTAATEKGREIAEALLGATLHWLGTMPVDAWWAVDRMIRHVQPSFFLLVETDIWPALLDALRRRGVSALLINGRISPRTFRAYRRAPFVVRNMMSSLDGCLVQSDLDAERLLRLGVDADKVQRVGNIKFDREWTPMTEEERRRLSADLCLNGGAAVWVAGSTHPGEETILLRVHRKLLRNRPGLRLILAPRQVERGAEILAEARRMGLDPVLRTNISRPCRDHSVLILNTLGELGRVYGLGEVGFVGGSLAPFGGHNLLEPAGFGCPVLFGPHTHNFVDMSRSLTAAGGGRRVRNEGELLTAVEELMADEALRRRMGGRARDFVRSNRGAVDRVLRCMRSIRG